MPRAISKKIVRKVDMSMVRDRGKLKALVATIYPNGTLGLRPEKTRREEVITLESCYGLAIKQRAARERAAKLEAKKLKKQQRHK